MKVGDEVVCVIPPRDVIPEVLRMGETYVVQAVEGPVYLGSPDNMMVTVRGAERTIITYSWRFKLKEEHELRHNSTTPT